MTREREYLVQSTYKVTGTAIIRARSAREAVEIGLSPDTPNFNFSDAWGESKMTARLLPSGIHKPNDAEELTVKLVRTRVNRDKLAQALWNTESAVTIAENEMTRQHRDRYLAAHDAEAADALELNLYQKEPTDEH